MDEKSIRLTSEEVRAVLDGRKTQKRFVIKPQPYFVDDTAPGINPYWRWDDIGPKGHFYGSGTFFPNEAVNAAPYQPGDILWVKETWQQIGKTYFYKADKKCIGCTEDGVCLPKGVERHATCELCEYVDGYFKWRPSIHMPRAAARIFLRVTNVRVERLQDITEEDAIKEGVGNLYLDEIAYSNNLKYEGIMETKTLAREQFELLWNSTIKKQNLGKYGWDANPWVWCVEFERVEP